jgi:hypothetical protein
VGYELASMCVEICLGRNSQPCANVYISARNFVRADKNVSAVSSCTVNADRVLAAVRLRSVERDFAALVAVGSIGGPRGLVPAVFEAFGHLRDGEGGCERDCEKSCLSEHDGYFIRECEAAFQQRAVVTIFILSSFREPRKAYPSIQSISLLQLRVAAQIFFLRRRVRHSVWVFGHLR